MILSYIDFTHIEADEASNTAADDVTNYVTNRIFNTNLKYSCANSTLKICEKSSLTDSF